MSIFQEFFGLGARNRLHRYPALRFFDQEEALKRLLTCEHEELDACRPWPAVIAVFHFVLLGLLASALILHYHRIVYLFALVALPATWVYQYMLRRRIRRRVEQKVAAELRDGRVWKCVECGYDLRESKERCPECGTSIHARRLWKV